MKPETKPRRPNDMIVRGSKESIQFVAFVSSDAGIVCPMQISWLEAKKLGQWLIQASRWMKYQERQKEGVQ